MTTAAFHGPVYERPSTHTGFFGFLRNVLAAAERRIEEGEVLSHAASLGPEQLKEMGAYADPETGRVYDAPSHV